MLGFERDGYPVRQHAAVRPVHHRRQIAEAARPRHVRRVQYPHRVAALDLPIAETLYTSILPFDPLGHVPEIAGHRSETTGQVRLKYTACNAIR